MRDGVVVLEAAVRVDSGEVVGSAAELRAERALIGSTHRYRPPHGASCGQNATPDFRDVPVLFVVEDRQRLQRARLLSCARIIDLDLVVHSRAGCEGGKGTLRYRRRGWRVRRVNCDLVSLGGEGHCIVHLRVAGYGHDVLHRIQLAYAGRREITRLEIIENALSTIQRNIQCRAGRAGRATRSCSSRTLATLSAGSACREDLPEDAANDLPK